MLIHDCIKDTSYMRTHYDFPIQSVNGNSGQILLCQTRTNFYKLYTFFFGGILWWKDRVIIIYSKLCNMTTFKTYIGWIRLESQINTFWYCLKVIKRHIFYYLIKLIRISGNHSSSEILQLFNCYCNMALLKFIDMVSLVFVFYSCTIQL